MFQHKAGIWLLGSKLFCLKCLSLVTFQSKAMMYCKGTTTMFLWSCFSAYGTVLSCNWQYLPCLISFSLPHMVQQLCSFGFRWMLSLFLLVLKDTMSYLVLVRAYEQLIYIIIMLDKDHDGMAWICLALLQDIVFQILHSHWIETSHSSKLIRRSGRPRPTVQPLNVHLLAHQYCAQRLIKFGVH